MSQTEEHTDGAVPKFVEGDYGMETPQEVDDDGPPPACGTRFCSEWRYVGWFGIQEGSKTLDIPASFGPTSWLARAYKLGALVWIVQTWFFRLFDTNPVPFFFAYLTHWCLTATALWAAVSFVNSLWGPTQPQRNSDETVSTWTKVCWLLYTATANVNFVVVTLFWTIEYDYSAGVPPTYKNLMAHGGTFILCWIDGLIVNRIPFRLKHVPVPMLLAATYVAWLAIHQMLTDIGNPQTSDNDPETNDDLIYGAVNFKENAVFSSVLVVFVVLVYTPLVHLLLWSLSLYSFPCGGCRGMNRRYLSVAAKNDEGAGSEGPCNNNVNVYEKA